MRFTTRPELRGTFGAVASTHWLASSTGMAVLERGGNAFDAACAAGFVLQVVEPHLNGPGGDLPAVFWSAERGEPLVLCAQGVAPAAATIERVPGARPRARARHRPARSMRARRVRRLAAAARAVRHVAARRRARVRDRLRRGRLSRSCPGSRATIERAEPLLRDWPGSAELYLPAPRPGSTLSQPGARRDLAAPARRGARRIARARARARAARLLRGLRRRGDRPRSRASRTGCSRATTWRAGARRSSRRRRSTIAASPSARRAPWGQGPVGAAAAARCSRASTSATLERGRARARRRPSARSSRSPTATRCYGDADVPLERLLSRDMPTSAGPRSATRRAATAARASAGCRRSSTPPAVARRGRADARRHRAPRRRRPLRQPGLGDAERRLAASSPTIPALGWPLGTRRRCSGSRRACRRRCARAAAAHDALAGARAARRRAVARVGHAGRRPAGAVGAARLPAPRRPRARTCRRRSTRRSCTPIT